MTDKAQPALSRRGLMLVLSSPSGAGKTTISRRLVEGDPSLRLSISATTRKPRPGEIDGVHYYFLTPEAFADKVAKGEFLEHAQVFGNRYGTLKAPVEDALVRGFDVLFDIDWQGTQQLAEKMRQDLVSIFILPPSASALEQRLRARAQDSDEVIRGRMAKASDEMSHWSEYDYIIVNKDLELSLLETRSILIAERLRRPRQIGLSDFVRDLREEAA